MRVTDNTTANVVFNGLQRIRERSEALQQQASTGYKITAPSDDPTNAQQILYMKGLMADGDQYLRNISSSKTWLAQAESSLSEMGNVVIRAKELALGMANGTNDATARLNVLNEVKQLKNQLVQLGNTQIAGKYIFGGFRNDVPPFDTTPVNIAGDPRNGTAGGSFTGTDDDIRVEIDQNSYIVMNYSGGKLLRGGTPPGSSGTDIIGELDNPITSLANNNVTGIETATTKMDNSLNQILAVRSDMGARMNRVESSTSIIDGMKYSLTKAVSDKQDVDFLQVMSDLSKQQTAFQAAVSASAKITQLSLLDYLK